jgi:HPt (histidine-containing phosphotransfer) domain-containing protein
VSGEPSLDPVVVERLKELGGDDDPGFFRGLVDEFLSNADQTVDAMRAAALAGDSPRLADLGHALKGSAANLGARALSAKAGDVERAGKAREPEAASDLVEEAAAELGRVRPLLVRAAGRAP